MQISFTYYQDPIPTQIVRMIFYTARNPTVVVAMEEFNPPHLNPRDVSVFVPTPEVHVVEIYETPGGISVGVLKARYVVTASLSAPRITPPLEIVVGGGRDDRDPVDGANGVVISTIDGIPISWVEQKGAGPLTGADSPNPADIEWLTRTGGGIDLQNGKIFNNGERYWLFFEPYIDSNITSAIFDLTAFIQNHIDDHANPHAVTKSQVGLGNLPNAISDSYQLDDSATLATSKAVYSLWQSLSAVILYVGNIHLGDIGNIINGGAISNAVNSGGVDSKCTVTHNQGIVGNYMVFCSLQGRSSTVPVGGQADWNRDNDSIVVVGNVFTPNAFDLLLRKVSTNTTDLICYYMIVKV
jgi:hypothetical protein